MALVDQVVAWLAQQHVSAYLVGGPVRDRLLGRAVDDLDVVVAADGLLLARSLADRFRGDFFPLDRERRTGRAILPRADEPPLTVDLAQMRGADLAADLADRDFTINALAADVSSVETTIDHHGGLADLEAALIRPVTPDSIRNDPLRALRAVRLAGQLGFGLTKEAESAIRRDGAGLADIAEERIRDELAHLLALAAASDYLQKLHGLAMLFIIFPELELLDGLAQPMPHHLDVLCHSLETVNRLEAILRALQEAGDPLLDLHGLSSRPLEPYAEPIHLHLSRLLSDRRARLVTLKLAALLHDTGKPQVADADPERGTRFVGHEQNGARIAALALRRLRFSGAEVRLAETIVYNHMRPLHLAKQPGVSRRAVYRFFRATGDAGVEVLLHALADQAATYGPGTGGRQWSRLISVAVRMLGDYWQHRTERVNPARLVNGHDLMSELGLQPGPQIGDLLEAVREAQATDQLRTREEAMAFVRSLLKAGEGSYRE